MFKSCSVNYLASLLFWRPVQEGGLEARGEDVPDAMAVRTVAENTGLSLEGAFGSVDVKEIKQCLKSGRLYSLKDYHGEALRNSKDTKNAVCGKVYICKRFFLVSL